eukprot:472648_1
MNSGQVMQSCSFMHLSNIVHASTIEMDKSSVSAHMRATSDQVLMRSALSESPRARATKHYNGFVMRAERPFLMMVRYRESGALLFIGRIGAPDGGQVSEPAPPSPVVVMPVQRMIVPNVLGTKEAEPDYPVESTLPESMTGCGDPNDGRNPCFTLRDLRSLFARCRAETGRQSPGDDGGDGWGRDYERAEAFSRYLAPCPLVYFGHGISYLLRFLVKLYCD